MSRPDEAQASLVLRDFRGPARGGHGRRARTAQLLRRAALAGAGVAADRGLQRVGREHADRHAAGSDLQQLGHARPRASAAEAGRDVPHRPGRRQFPRRRLRRRIGRHEARDAVAVGRPPRLGGDHAGHLRDGSPPILLPHPQHRPVAAARCAGPHVLLGQRLPLRRAGLRSGHPSGRSLHGSVRWHPV